MVVVRGLIGDDGAYPTCYSNNVKSQFDFRSGYERIINVSQDGIRHFYEFFFYASVADFVNRKGKYIILTWFKCDVDMAICGNPATLAVTLIFSKFQQMFRELDSIFLILYTDA